MGAINRDWHVANRMPAKPSQEDRAVWHVAHADACGCRAPSEKEQALIDAWKAPHPRQER